VRTTGLFRLWLIASICWATYTGWNSRLACPLTSAGLKAGSEYCEFKLVYPDQYYTELVFEMLGYPLIAGLLILAAVWIARGFTRGPGTQLNQPPPTQG
jgi:hypothetical protein